MKIGIMGGTFDPIHNGHLMLGNYAYKLFKLDQVWFLPNGNPPHKSDDSIESMTANRVEMVRRAISPYKHFYLETYEVNRTEVSYSYQTMQYFQEKYPEHEFYFIIGADSLFSIEKWKYPEKLLRTCIILAAYRNGKGTQEMLSQIHYLARKYECDIRLMNTPDVDISSSQIRQQIKEGRSICEFVPKDVEEYIREKHLFEEEVMEQLTIQKMKEKVKKHLDSNRYEHTLGVMYTAGALAMRYNVDLEKTMIAGLLHDCAKCIPAKEKITLCRQYKLPISEAEQNNPGLLHAKLGAYLAKEKYHVRDKDILSAIASHTTGRPNMSLLEKIIYIADYIEPGRKEAPNLCEIRHLAFTDIDECLYTILHASLAYLESRNEVIDPLTEQTYLYYKERRK